MVRVAATTFVGRWNPYVIRIPGNISQLALAFRQLVSVAFVLIFILNLPSYYIFLI